jgi:amino acid permease
VSADDLGLLTREELLGGLPARRASTLLFAIESRTAHLVARSRQAMATFHTEKTAEAQERAFLEALSQGRDLPLQPTIQDLERYASEWAPLVPPDAGVRAALARMIGEKYPVPHRFVPASRLALGLDEGAVRQAYERLHGQPLDAVYVTRVPWRERLRWARARLALRLETLPAFWTAFALTLTETVGAGILALPIALAEIGPLGGLAVLLGLGLVSLLTIAAMAEAVSRNGNIRYGRAYFSRLVTDYLGPAGVWLLSPTLILLNVVVLLAYYVGFASTLAVATGLPAEGWAALLFVVAVALLRRKTLDATVAAALAVSAVSIGLILLLSVLALTHLEGANLRHSQIPFLDGEPFDASILELIFGVVLGAYFGHTSAANSAAVVLQRDPTARSYIRGSVAALATAMGLYCVWVVAVNGAVAPAALAGASGTALEPLAAEVGPGVDVLGSIFAVLAMGMASIHVSLGLSNQTREWLPPSWGSAGRARPKFGLPAFVGDGRFWLGMLPVVANFVLVEALLLADRASFAGPLALIGTLAAPVLAGVFPMLMVVASRRKGDCEVGSVWRLVGHPVVVASTYGFFLAALLLHGLVIWDEPVRRAAALLTAAAAVAVTAVAVRRGAFWPRTVIEVRIEPAPTAPAVVNVVVTGRRVPADVRLTYHEPGSSGWTPPGREGKSSALRSVHVELPPSPVRELKVWAHRLVPEGVSEPLPAQVDVSCGATVQRRDLWRTGGQAVVPLDGAACPVDVQMTFAPPA